MSSNTKGQKREASLSPRSAPRAPTTKTKISEQEVQVYTAKRVPTTPACDLAADPLRSIVQHGYTVLRSSLPSAIVEQIRAFSEDTANKDRWDTICPLGNAQAQLQGAYVHTTARQ